MTTKIDFYPSLLQHKRAVTLVTHGLNLRPEAMLSLVNWLVKHGSDVFLLTLAGHDKNGLDIGNVTSLQWKQDMLAGYESAKECSSASCVPLYFLGYSLGALLGYSMLALTMGCHVFEKQILFAPAIAIRRRSYLIKFLFLLGSKRRVPSYSPPAYRVNKSLPLFVYDILFSEEKKVSITKFEKIDIPTLIIIDPKDELISFKKLIRMIDRFSLKNCNVIPLKEEFDKRAGHYHHLIIDEQTMGERNWEKVLKEMKKFLFDDFA